MNPLAVLLTASVISFYLVNTYKALKELEVVQRVNKELNKRGFTK